jgi:hypothetical protein
VTAALQRQQPDTAALVALTTALLNGNDIEAVLAHVLAGEDELVTDFAFRDRTKVRKAARLAASLLPPERPLLGQSTGPAGRFIRRTSVARRAAYILAAARRMAVAEPDLEAERRYLAQHLSAERGRDEAAARVDQASSLYGPIVGWVSRKDDRVTPECAAAAGWNFRAAKPPVIGYPGTLHGSTCRCVAGPPFPGGRLLP